jgi:arsenate reductase
VSITIYHNPKCSKSRQTLKLLEEQAIGIDVIEYLKNPPTVKKLKEILSLLKISPRDLMRKKEAEYKDLGLYNFDLSDECLIESMVKHPILIERPIVLANGKAALGRPPEKVLNIF